jgi:hypothetical protein
MTQHVSASTAVNQEKSGLTAVDITYVLLDGDVTNVPLPVVQIHVAVTVLGGL